MSAMELAPLADPSRMSAQERTSELAQAVEGDDVLGCLLVLSYSEDVPAEINGRSSRTGRSPLETAVISPIRRVDVRRIIVEILLHGGANADEVLARRFPSYSYGLVDIVKGWNRGGRATAVASYDLRYTKTLHEAESFLRENGLDVASLPPPVQPSPSLPTPHAASPPSQQTARSSRRSQSPEPRRESGSSSRRARADDSRTSRRSLSPAPSRRSRRSPSPSSSKQVQSATTPSWDWKDKSASTCRSPSPARHRRSPLPARLKRRTSYASSSRRDETETNLESHRSSRSTSGRRQPLHSPEVPSLREFSPEAGTSRKPVEAGNAKHNQKGCWIFVGNMPPTVAERYLYDRLVLRGIDLTEIFMSQGGNGLRFAFVGFPDASNGRLAIASLDGLNVNGVNIMAKPFKDVNTGSSVPEVGAGRSGPYIGAQAAAERSQGTRVGLALLHVAPRATSDDVATFISTVVQPADIFKIDVRTLRGAVSTMAFVHLADREAAKRAILELDGKVFCGHAVKVGWMLEDTRHKAAPSRVEPAHLDPPPAPATKSRSSSHNWNAPASRAAQQERWDHEEEPADDPTPSTSKRRRLLDNDASASTQPRSQDSKDAVNDHTASKLPASRSANAVDTTRLLDLGLSAFEVDAIQRVLRPSIEPDSSNKDRSMDVKARFGFLSSDKAKAALEAQETVKAFPYDPKRQQRYEAFLRAQAGEDQAYFTVFFAQLFEFNSSNELFVAMANESLESTTGREVRGSGNGGAR